METAQVALNPYQAFQTKFNPQLNVGAFSVLNHSLWPYFDKVMPTCYWGSSFF